jgi:hypothetical protein
MTPTGNNITRPSLPDVFCWTKFGAEAGELPLSIFERKEEERRRNGGIFLWGIGQSIGPSLPELLRVAPAPEVLFSPIKSGASPRDASPAEVVLWCDAIGYDGHGFKLPQHSLVTSRMDPVRPRRAHYALVCQSESPLLKLEGNGQHLTMDALRNLRSGTCLGASQVTSVVRRIPAPLPTQVGYPVVARAALVYPYLVRLTRALPVPEQYRIDRAMPAALETALMSLLRLKDRDDDCLFSREEMIDVGA